MWNKNEFRISHFYNLRFKARVLYSLLIFALLAFACASQQQTAKKTESKTLSGVVQLIGNDPFTTIAIRGSDGKIYRIVAPKEMENRLRKLQGIKVTVEYSSMTTTVEGPVVAVKNILE